MRAIAGSCAAGPNGLNHRFPRRPEPVWFQGPTRMVRGHSSVGRALQWHCRGQGFDSPWLHHFCLRVAAHQPNPLVPVRGFSAHLRHFFARASFASLNVSAGAGESPGRGRGLVPVRGISPRLHHTLCVASCLRVAARQPNPLVPVRGFSAHLRHVLSHAEFASLISSGGAGESPGRSRAAVAAFLRFELSGELRSADHPAKPNLTARPAG